MIKVDDFKGKNAAPYRVQHSFDTGTFKAECEEGREKESQPIYDD